MLFKKASVITMSFILGVLIIALSVPSIEVIAAEPLSDWELATLYGGWNWFYNPYCGVSGNNCPQHTECGGAWDKCRFCNYRIGARCFSDYSWWPDLDGCKDGSRGCPNAPWVPVPDIPDVYGFCSMQVCIPEYWESGPPYPNCYDMYDYDWCDEHPEPE